MRPARRSTGVAATAAARRPARPGWRPLLALLVLGIPLALAGCGGGGGQRRGALDLEMLDNFYKRDLVQVPAGTLVRFSNRGRAVHNAVAANGGWATPMVIQPGRSATLTLSKPGVYHFYCTFHGTKDGQGMAGTVVVGDIRYESSEATTGRQLPVTDRASGVTRRVPRDFPTITAAVNAARPGDLVLVGAGVYREEVKVTIPSLVIRGTDRNRVIVDGEFRRPNAISVTADGVAVENLTVRNAVANGLFWTGVTGYRASYVTASNNGDYGIYAFGSRDGVFERSYASGSPDAGFYIGQCNPCDAVIDGVTSENNALGYSGTNASDLDIVRSTFRRNWAGIVPNTGDYELMPPFADVRIVGNLVQGNGNRGAPGLHVEWSAFGNGIVLAGGNDSLVQRNLVIDHPNHGILVTPNLDEHFWTSSGNQVRDNLIRGSGRADLALAGPAGAGNCFSGNQVRATIPVGLQLFQGCDGPRLPARMDLSTTLQSLGLVAQANSGKFPHNRSQDAAPAPPQPDMPGGAAAQVQPAVGIYQRHHVDLSQIALPVPPAGQGPTVRKEPTVFGVPILATSAWQLVFGLYGYLLPFALFAAWVSLALWDLARRDDLSRAAIIAWIAVVLVVPFLGVIVYHAFGRPKLAGWLRVAMIGGGIAAYVIILGIGALIGGIV
jgi:plastocyanin